MLVTTPAQRATLAEVASHPWMTKGYDGPANCHLPDREPVRFGELDQEVIKGMTGFEFGTAEEIENKLGDVLTTDAYLNALACWDEKRGRASAPAFGRSSSQDRLGNFGSPDSLGSKAKSSNKRFSGLGFYGKKISAVLSGKSDDASTNGDNSASGKMANAQTTGAGGVKVDLTDPTRGYHPLLSIYYLVKEKIERDALYGPGVFASSTLSLSPLNASAPAATNGANTAAKYDYSARSPNPAVALPAPVPAATAGKGGDRILRPPQAARGQNDENTPLAQLARPPPSAAEDGQMGRSPSQQSRPMAHRRTPTVPLSAPTSPNAMQGGFRRTAAPDPEPPTAVPRVSHSSTPASHRHSIHLPASASPQQVRVTAPTPGAESTSGEVPMSPSGHASGSLMKRFGSILGRGNGDDAKKAARQQRLASISLPQPQASSAQSTPTKPGTENLAPQPVQENESLSQDSDIPLAPAGAPRSVARANTTAADLSPGSRLQQQSQHTRGVSIDTASPGSRRSTGPPLADRRRQVSMSVAHRRPKTAGATMADQAVPEVDENVQPATPGLFDDGPENAVATDSKPVYLKVGLTLPMSKGR